MLTLKTTRIRLVLGFFTYDNNYTLNYLSYIRKMILKKLYEKMRDALKKMFVKIRMKTFVFILTTNIMYDVNSSGRIVFIKTCNILLKF